MECKIFNAPNSIELERKVDGWLSDLDDIDGANLAIEESTYSRDEGWSTLVVFYSFKN